MRKTTRFRSIVTLAALTAAVLAAGARPARADANYYLSRLSSMLAGRPLNAAERTQIAQGGQASIEPIVRAWLEQPYTENVFRSMVRHLLKTSGSRDGVDWELPGNLARYMVRNNLPYSTLLTADYCVDANFNKIGCDTGAPFTAGVLTTRAYLLGHKGRFNLGRAGFLLKAFACREYPVEPTMQPGVARERLISMFQHDETSETLPGGGFGNGLACYSCHSQFAQHAQPFVKFNQAGQYIANATGLQLAGGEPGVSANNTYASHLSNATEAASQATNMFGTQVSNLREAATVVTHLDAFAECAVKNTLMYFLRIDSVVAGKIDKIFFKEVAKSLLAKKQDPTFRDIALHVLTHPVVIQSVDASAGK